MNLAIQGAIWLAAGVSLVTLLSRRRNRRAWAADSTATAGRIRALRGTIMGICAPNEAAAPRAASEITGKIKPSSSPELCPGVTFP